MIGACRNYRERALIGLMGLCGARIGEALDARPEWFDVQEQLLTIRGKGDKTRIVPVSTDAWQAIAEAYVWATVNGPGTLVRLRDRHARTVVKQIGQRANLSREISSHDLRHTFATGLLNKGVNIRVVQELLGHASVETTQIYTGVELEALRSAVQL
jgi:integrase/recombinase XerD